MLNKQETILIMHFFWEIIYVCVWLCMCMCVYENRWENEVLHMKWQVLQITVFKRLIYLSNFNKQVLKINFKLLLKWTFVQNQSCRILKRKQLSCSNIFKLLYKKWRKIWISKCIGHFQMHSSFKFYLSTETSNEKVPKMKVVDLKILSKFGIQKFFFMPRKRRKI